MDRATNGGNLICRTVNKTKYKHMKTNTAPEEIAAIIAALEKIHVRPFAQESGDPKYDAQRNLRGKTHYVDDDTLRFHKSRVLSSARLHGGLLLRIITSDALDMHNTKRGFRAVVFDVFGTTVERPSLDNASKTKAQAYKQSEATEIDLVAHYKAALASQASWKQREIDELNGALAAMPYRGAVSA